MEYTFKNSIREGAQTILLQGNRLLVQFPEREESYTYDRVASIKLVKSKHNLFALTLVFDTGRSIVVTNKYFLSPKECEDRSTSYDTFVRVLHFHLQEKSHAKYYSGVSMQYLETLMLGAAMASFVISFISEYFGFSVTNSLTQASILSVFAVAIILIANKRFFTKAYSPFHIPFEFLPRRL